MYMYQEIDMLLPMHIVPLHNTAGKRGWIPTCAHLPDTLTHARRTHVYVYCTSVRRRVLPDKLRHCTKYTAAYLCSIQMRKALHVRCKPGQSSSFSLRHCLWYTVVKATYMKLLLHLWHSCLVVLPRYRFGISGRGMRGCTRALLSPLNASSTSNMI